MKKIMSMVLIVGLFAVIGCYGPFALTSKLNKGIRSIGEKGGEGNKWAAEGVFLICAIIPVYAIAILGDALIFNSIQFWTGDNPIAKNYIDKEGSQAVVKYNNQENKMDVFLFDNYIPINHFTLAPDANGKMTAYTSSGAYQAKVLGNGSYVLNPI